MSTAVERFDENRRRRVDAHGSTQVRDDELLRHSVYTRCLHWSAAIFFILALLSGFALYTPWLFRLLTPLFGGGSMTRLLHPWFSLGFVAIFAFQVLNWLQPMSWTSHDSRWMRRVKDYVTNTEKLEPEYVDFFNGGQKAYFWAIVGSAVLFVISGFPMWFPTTFGRSAAAVAYVLHDVAALVMLVGFIIHVYEGTAAQPGTFRAMTRGMVDKRWAWTHHPAWYRAATGRDPRADYDRARQRQTERSSRGETS
jgi:formate dehydrogenase subunit gamma